MWNDLKYCIAYSSPLAAGLGIAYGGIWSPGAYYVGFLLIPLIELVIPLDPTNTAPELDESRNRRRFFDVLLYFNLPIVLGLAAFFAWRLGHTALSAWEIAGMTVSMGVIFGTCGINVAHELGHRPDRFSQWISRLLLVPSFYTHFTIEHNYGHHRHVGTPDDPATARKGESIYAFWWRSVIGSCRNAWRLEAERLHKAGKGVIHHQLLWGVGLQGLYLTLIVVIGGWFAVPFLLISGIHGFLLLETVNYIEHYGLIRRQLPSGMYEPVEAVHSWNSNHQLGRIFLYELTRHADHHYRTSRHYQILRHLEDAPQLPAGYPASLLLAMIPPLWRRVVDQRIKS